MLALYNINDESIHEIPINMEEYSPLLRTMLSTQVGIDRDNHGNIKIDCDHYCLKQYISFLMGEEFNMDENVQQLFHYFGHENTLNYPLDFWKVKLYDTWIRDNCYKLELFKNDPYYGLYEIKPLKSLRYVLPNKLPSGHYIAGGAVLYMLGITNTYTDVDIFTTNINESINYMKKLVNDGHQLYYSDNCVILPNKAQLILRSYSCPSEIVHGFDLGCCGVIMVSTDDEDKVFCTRRALYSIFLTRSNWLEPDRSSPSLIHRLLKYSNRNAFIDEWYKGIYVKYGDRWEVVLPNVPYHNDIVDGHNIMGGFKIMLIGTDELRFDGDYYSRMLSCMEKDVMKHETIQFMPYGEVNLKDVTLQLYKYKTGAVITDIQYWFMEQLYSDSYNGFNTQPVPLIRKPKDVYELLNSIWEGLNDRCVRMDQTDTSISRMCYIDSINDYNVVHHDNSIPTRDDLHSSLDINVDAYDIIENLGIDDEEQGNIISCYSFLKNHPNPLAYIIRNNVGDNTLFYHDDASLILLQCMFGIGYWISCNTYTKRKHNSDYMTSSLMKLVDPDILEWKIINPMEQLTGSFHPETIQDIEQWFKSSPLIIDNGIRITTKRYNEITK